MSLSRFSPGIVIRQDGVDKISDPKVLDFRGDVTVTQNGDVAEVDVTVPTTLGNQEFQILPYFAEDIQSLSFGAVTALQVIVMACRFDSMTIDSLLFRITSGASGQVMAMGVYDGDKNLTAETGWLTSASIGNKSKSGLATVLPLETGYIAYARSTTGTTGIMGLSLSANLVNFLNGFDDVFIGSAANAAASGAAGDPAMPATLGTITPFTTLTFFPTLIAQVV